MIKIVSKTGRKTHCKMSGNRFEVANEAVNIAVTLVNAIGDADAALGEAVRKTIIGALEGRVQPREESAAEDAQ